MEDSNNKVLKSDRNKIGALPDSVLYHILSFLDMKEVVGTSLVSRRWRYLWASIPVLNFDHNMWNKVCTNTDNPSKQGFMNFVDRVLLLHDGSRVSKFRISYSIFCDSDRITAWLTVAARRQFQEIHLVCANKQMKLPRLLFTSEITLFTVQATKSQITGHSPVAYLIEVPNSVSLSPQLKTLRLDFAHFPKGNSNGEFMLSCPVLENLTLINCNQRHLDALIISVPQLKKLVIVNYKPDLVGSCHIKIWTPNLSFLSCTGYGYSNYSLMKYSSLDVANVRFVQGQQVAHNLVKLLEAVSCASTIELLFQDYEHTLTKLITQFINLRHLKVKIHGGKKLSIRVVLNLLKNAPRIETLLLDALKLDDYDEEVVPFKCSHLKAAEIGRIEGLEYEVKFLKFLLKNAVALEKLMIKMCVNSPVFAKDYLWGKMLSLPRASTGITVVIV